LTAEQKATAAVAEFRTLWVGPPLSVYEELSLRSLTARGQRVFLYSYDRKLRAPEGVELLDANEIVPGDRIHRFVHRNGEVSLARHSDLFRYEVLKRFGGWYCDLDVVLMADRPPATEFYVGREDETWANGAVMRFPPNAQLMVAAAESAKALMGSTDWGAVGPQLLTRMIDEYGLQHLVLPWPVAYPIRTSDVAKLFQPRYRDELEERSAGAPFVHFWNEVWRAVRIPKNFGPPEGSFLDGLFNRFGFRFAPEARLTVEAVRSWFRETYLVDEARSLGGPWPSLRQIVEQSERDRAERDCVAGERDLMMSERDLALQERDRAIAERDHANAERDAARRLEQSETARLSAALAYARWQNNELAQKARSRMMEPMRAVARRWRAAAGPPAKGDEPE
jgi:hypothetical protein